MPDRDPRLDKIGRWQAESEQLRTQHDNRWAKNIQLIQGILNDGKKTHSDIRKRSKLFFRKIWAINWRLLAAFYQAFLRDVDLFKISGRDDLNDFQKAEVLHNMVNFRKDQMMNEESLFIKFIWALQNIIDFGWAPAKFGWAYNPETGKDGPDFVLYPVEQVYPDFGAWTKEKMRYIIFENFLTKQELIENKYEDIDEARPEPIPSNIVRQARFMRTDDPLQNPSGNEYPEPGRYPEDRQENVNARYKVWECFYIEGGRIKLGISNGGKFFFKKPVNSPYGNSYPCLMGTCLTKVFQLVGEGFAESLEGPQESINDTINKRKDNVSLLLNKGAVVSRYANVDLNSLVNARPARIVLADDPAAVVWENPPDVTGSAYIEVAADEAMMQEMSGVTPGKQGMGKEQKATTSQINFSESNAKIELFAAIIGETFFKDFFYQLAGLIQRFETDEMVFRIANNTFRTKNNAMFAEEIYRVDDFNFDCKISVGEGAAGRQIQIQQLLLTMDKAIMSNQANAGLLQTGMVPPEGIRFFDVTKIAETLFPKIGQKNLQEYFFNIKPNPQAQGALSGISPQQNMAV